MIVTITVTQRLDHFDVQSDAPRFSFRVERCGREHAIEWIKEAVLRAIIQDEIPDIIEFKIVDRKGEQRDE